MSKARRNNCFIFCTFFSTIFGSFSGSFSARKHDQTWRHIRPNFGRPSEPSSGDPYGLFWPPSGPLTILEGTARWAQGGHFFRPALPRGRRRSRPPPFLIRNNNRRKTRISPKRIRNTERHKEQPKQTEKNTQNSQKDSQYEGK